MSRFYNRHTSNIFITEQSTRTVHSGFSPREISSEILRTGSNQMAMAYVIENHIKLNRMKYYRVFNVFLVDSYESFRYIIS